MHVLILCRSFPHHRPGGMEWHVQDVAEGLMAAGYKVSVMTTPLPQSPALLPLEVNGEIGFLGKKSGRYDPWFFLDAYRKARPFAQKIGAGIVHAQGFAGIPVSWRRNEAPPLVTTVHGTLWSETALSPYLPKKPMPWQILRLHWRYRHRHLFSFVWKRFLRSKTRMILDSRFSVRALKKEAGRLGSLPMVVPLGFDLSRFPMGDRQELRKKWGAQPDEPLVVTVGRLEAVKGPATILRSFDLIAKEHPNARLIIAGEGPERRSLQQFAKNKNLQARVRFPGRVSAQDLPGLLQAADLFMNADRGAPAFGLVNAEALCMGTRVLASQSGAHPEVVNPPLDGELLPAHGRTAWKVALAEALQAFPESSETRENRAHRARQRFSRDHMIERLTRAYSWVLDFS